MPSRRKGGQKRRLRRQIPAPNRYDSTCLHIVPGCPGGSAAADTVSGASPRQPDAIPVRRQLTSSRSPPPSVSSSGRQLVTPSRRSQPAVIPLHGAASYAGPVGADPGAAGAVRSGPQRNRPRGQGPGSATGPDRDPARRSGAPPVGAMGRWWPLPPAPGRCGSRQGSRSGPGPDRDCGGLDLVGGTGIEPVTPAV